MKNYKDEYSPDYKPIPIYDNVEWNLVGEAAHAMILAPSGAGKTLFLSYLAGMILKRKHKLFIVDAKKTAFGEVFRTAGAKVACTPDQIILLLTNFVEAMEQDYENYFAHDTIDLDTNYSSLGLPAHVLIFDEVLSALESGNRKQKLEMERLLKILTLKGRMAGYIVLITSQKLLASDLSKSITEQCQLRFIMGALVSDELFHITTGAYKKDLVTNYKGGIGKGYAMTPTLGLTYFEVPEMNFDNLNFKQLMIDLKKRGTPYGEYY